jgi:hypothetical protein
MGQVPAIAGLGWSKAMREAKKKDGEACEICAKPGHNVLMVGMPTPGGLEFQGQLRLCDECADEVLQGGNAMELLERKKGER